VLLLKPLKQFLRKNWGLIRLPLPLAIPLVLLLLIINTFPRIASDMRIG